MFKIDEYANAFKKGMNYILYGSDAQTRELVTLDVSNMESIGYYDGYQYGEFLELTCQTMSISDEQLIAVIDKYHTQALKRYKNYIYYKSGFIEGRFSVLEKVRNGNMDFAPLLEPNIDDWNSIGYYDGYSHSQNEFLLTDEISCDNHTEIYEIVYDCFQQRIKSLTEKEKKQR